MPTPSSGPLSFSSIASIVFNNTSSQINMGNSLVRTLAGIGSGQLSFSSLRNKPTAGSANYTTPGTYTFLCPAYQNISIDVRGGGGGGGGGGTAFVFVWAGNPGQTGTESRFGSPTPVVAGPGAGGNGGCGGGPGGDNGTGSGGDNQGATGGAGGFGGTPNGGCGGQPGGTGNRQTKSWVFNSTAGYPVWGTNYTVVVGSGGVGGQVGDSRVQSVGGNGGNGAVYISWS